MTKKRKTYRSPELLNIQIGQGTTRIGFVQPFKKIDRKMENSRKSKLYATCDKKNTIQKHMFYKHCLLVKIPVKIFLPPKTI